MTELKTLQIIKKENLFEYQIIEGQKLIRRAEIYVQPNMLLGLKGRMEKIVIEGIYGNRLITELMEIGNLMYRLLIPEEIKEFLKSSRLPLIINSEDSEIPWELVYDGSEFLGIKRSIGRNLVVAADSEDKDKEGKNEDPSPLLICNPTGDLKGADLEKSLLGELFSDNFGEFKALTKEKANAIDVGIEFGKGHKIIHYSGHIIYDKKRDECGLLLAKEFIEINKGICPSCQKILELRDDVLQLAENTQIVYTSEIAKVVEGNPFVFLNGCGVGIGTGKEREPLPSMKLLFYSRHLAEGFFRKAAACVATLWEVPDDKSALFAKVFYLLTLERNETVGDALRKTRGILRMLYPNDLTWASYILYGDPNFKISPQKKMEEKMRKGGKFFFSDDNLDMTKFSQPLRDIITNTLEEAIKLRNDSIEPSHFLLSLLKKEGGYTQNKFKEQGVIITNIIYTILSKLEFESIPKISVNRTSFSSDSLRIFEDLERTINDVNAENLKEEHLLLAVLKNLEKPIKSILSIAGIKIEKISQETEEDLIEIFDYSGDLILDNFDEDGLRILQIAVNEAQNMGFPVVGTPHLFIALTKIEGGVTQRALNEQNIISPKELRDLIRILFLVGGNLDKKTIIPLKKGFFRPRLEGILKKAKREAIRDESGLIGEKHLLKSIILDGEGLTITILEILKIDLEQMLETIT